MASGSSRRMAMMAAVERAEPLVSQEFITDAEFRTAQPRSTMFRHILGVAAMMAGLCLAGLCLAQVFARGPPSSPQQLGPSKFLSKQFLAKPSTIINMDSDYEVDDIICDKYPYFKLLEVTHSNLGGKGPDDGDEGVIFEVRNTLNDELMELHLNARGDYEPEIPKFNGCAGHKSTTGSGCEGRFGAFNLKAGTDAHFSLSFYDVATKEPQTVNHVAITWFDIDENRDHTNTEKVSMSGFVDYKLQDPTNVSVAINGSMTTWASSSYGDGENNPVGPDGLTSAQKELSVSVYYDKVNSMDMYIAAGGAGEDSAGKQVEAMPRFFTFILMPSIPCARTLLPALQWKSPQVAVESNGEFYKWQKNVGDPVHAGDVLVLVRTNKGIEEITVPPGFSGVLLARQPFHIGDIMEARMEKQPIAVLGEEPLENAGAQAVAQQLPALTVGSGQVGVDGTGTFLEWKTFVGQQVGEGDIIALVNVTERGPTVPVQAPYAGTVTDLQNFKRGDVMENRMVDQPIAVITSVGSLPLASGDEPVLISGVPHSGLTFVEYKKFVGDEVVEGETIATLSDVGGKMVPVKAPRDGFIKSEQMLEKGAVIDEQLAADGTLAVIQEQRKLVPLEQSRPLTPVESDKDGVLFNKFLVEERAEVDLNTPLASVMRPDGTEELLLAPSAGMVQALQGLKEGDSLDKLLMDDDFCVATVLPDAGSGSAESDPTLEGGEEVPSLSSSVSAVPGDLHFQWHKIVGDPVKKGDVIAVVLRKGEQVEIVSPRDGVVAATAPIDDGDAITDETSSPLATVEDPAARNATKVHGATAKEGDVFVTWIAKVNDFVAEDDVVCVLERDKQKTPIKAGKTGNVIFESALKPGDAIEGDQTDPLFLIDPVLPPFELTGASTQPGDHLVRWMKAAGDPVTKGDAVAIVKQEGKDVPIPAPQDGTVASEQELYPGDLIDRESSSPLFLVAHPTPMPDKIHGVSAVPEEDKLISWEKAVGDPVSEGDVIAIVERAGQTVELKAPTDGAVKFEEAVKPGGTLSEPQHSPLFQVESPSPLGSTSEGQDVEPGDELVDWKHDDGDRVKAGDVVAVVKRGGVQVPVQASKDGWVSYTAPVRPGEKIVEEKSRPLFSVDDGPFKPPPSGIGQSSEPGDKLVRWHKDLGEEVRKGNLVATITRSGVDVPLFAPVDGKVSFKQPLEAGDFIYDENTNPLFVITPPKDKLPPGVAMNAKPGDKFIEWRKDLLDPVGKGDVVCALERDGKEIELSAPTAGHVSFEQDWTPGQTIDASNDTPAFLVDPRQVGPAGEGFAVNAPDPEKLGFSFIRFKSWAVNVGDQVKPGDVVSVVELVPAGAGASEGEGGRRLTIASLLPKEIQVLSPVPGCVTELMNLHGGDTLEENYASRRMATISGCPMQWWIWPLLLLFILSCCLCCCIAMALKKRREDSYSTMKSVNNTTATVTGHHRPVFRKPEDPVTFDFEDEEGQIHSYKFTHRPLGIVYEKGHSPVRVQRCRFNSYARWMGVQDGWTIRKVSRTDVSAKTVEEVEQLTYEYLRDKPIWPLRLDFKERVPKDASQDGGDVYEKRIKSFLVTTQPIGMEFGHKLPIIVSKVFPDTFASDNNIERKWKLVGIGFNSHHDAPLMDLDKEPEDLDYKEIMRNFRDGVSLLDIREDNPQILKPKHVQKWEENLGEETTTHVHNGNGNGQTNGNAYKHSM